MSAAAARTAAILRRWALGAATALFYTGASIGVGAAQTQAPPFQEVFERHSAAMLWVEPIGGAVIDANPAAAQYYGYDRDAMRAMNIQQINMFTPEQIAAERTLAQTEGRNYFIFRHRLASGAVRTVEVRSNPFVVEGRTLLLSIVTDATAQRQDAAALWHYQSRLEETVDAQVRTIVAGERRMTQALLAFGAAQTLLIVALIVNIIRRRRSERRFRDVSEAAGEFIWETDARGRFTYASDRARQVLGYPSEDLLGRSLLVLIPKQDRAGLRVQLDDIAARRSPFRAVRQRIRRRDGGLIWLEITGLPRIDLKGRLEGYRGAALDVSEMVRLEEDRESMLRRLSRSNEEMARLAEVMAHHFQEPTRRIVSFSQRLHRKSATITQDSDAKISLDFIESEARRLRDLVRDVQRYLAAGRMEPPDAPTDSARLVDDILMHLGVVDADVRVGPLPPVWVGPRRLRDLWTALIDNALRHRAADKKLILEISAVSGDKRATFRIADNGPGVPDAYREQVFRLFERLPSLGVDRLGSGVGLSVARKVVESAGGRIYIDDGIDGGCAVIFDLPLELGGP